MRETPLAPSVYLEVLREETLRLADVAADCLDAQVPTCPDWDVAALLTHVGRVQRRIATRVRGMEIEDVEIPERDGLVPWIRLGVDVLVSALTDVGPDRPCQTLDDPNGRSSFWFRRTAHEVTIHRMDAELAAQRPVTAIDPTIAADAIDEVMSLHLGRWLAAHPIAGLGGSVAFEASDIGATWIVTLRKDGVAVDTLAAPTARALAPAEVLLRFLWNRSPVTSLVVEGDSLILDRWATQIRM